MILEMNKLEQDNYEKLYKQIDQEISTATHDIVRAKAELQQARKVNLNLTNTSRSTFDSETFSPHLAIVQSPAIVHRLLNLVRLRLIQHFSWLVLESEVHRSLDSSSSLYRTTRAYSMWIS